MRSWHNKAFLSLLAILRGFNQGLCFASDTAMLELKTFGRDCNALHASQKVGSVLRFSSLAWFIETLSPTVQDQRSVFSQFIIARLNASAPA